MQDRQEQYSGSNLFGIQESHVQEILKRQTHNSPLSYLNFTLILDFSKKSHKVYWSDDIVPFSRVPFIVVEAKFLDCHHGKDRNIELKKKSAKKKFSLVI